MTPSSFFSMFLKLCEKSFKFMGIIILGVFAVAILPWLGLLALGCLPFLAIIGAVVIVIKKIVKIIMRR